MLICSGECNREERPLACRIFPLFPIVYEDNGKNKIKIIYDPRAGMCPLARENRLLDPKFVKEVRMAARSLMRDSEILEYMKAVSEELTDILELKHLLGE